MKRVPKVCLIALAVAVLALAVAACGSEELAAPTKNIDIARDEAAKAGILAIETGIAAYVATSQAAPPLVDAATLGSFVSPWPTNPWTNEPMAPGTDPGEYSYQNLGGTSYSLVGHLSDGDYSRP